MKKKLRQLLIKYIGDYLKTKVKALVHHDKMFYPDENKFLKDTLIEDRYRRGELLEDLNRKNEEFRKSLEKDN